MFLSLPNSIFLPMILIKLKLLNIIAKLDAHKGALDILRKGYASEPSSKVKIYVPNVCYPDRRNILKFYKVKPI